MSYALKMPGSMPMPARILRSAPLSTLEAPAPASPAGDSVVQAGEVRIARIESLRALAAIAIIGAHTWGAVTGYEPELFVGTFPRRLMFGLGYSVFLFFALSGYLLSWPFVRRHFFGG